MNAAVKWQKIADDGGGYLYRAIVPGGWLVRYDSPIVAPFFSGQVGREYDYVACMTFMPDPNHQWTAEVTE